MTHVLLFMRQFIASQLGVALFSPLWLLRRLGAIIGNNVFADGLTVEEQLAPLLTIEDDVVLAYGCRIILHDSALNNLEGAPIKIGRVVIRRGAYIGARTTILPGIEIGERALIGACSLVTCDVPAGTVVYGVPAKPVTTVHEVHQAYLRKMMEPSDRVAYMSLIPWRQRHRILGWIKQRRNYRRFIMESFGENRNRPEG